MIELFWKAYLIGLAIAAPVGPISLLCIRQTLKSGFFGGLSVGLGVALADALYGLMVALGLTVLTQFLLKEITIIRIVGGCLLIYLGAKEIWAKPSSVEKTDNSPKSFFKGIFQTFFLTLSNPITILSFIAIFSALTVENPMITSSLWVVAGVFLGSLSWWIILASLIHRIRHKLPDFWINNLRYLSSIVLIGFGVWVFLQLL